MANSEWVKTTWGELATLEYGKGIRGYNDAEGDYRVFGTNGPIGWHTEAIYNNSSVIVGRKGAYRGVHYSPEPFFVIDTAFYLKPKVEFDMRWAYYQLLTQNINAMDSGSAIPSTSRDEFYHLKVSLPPAYQQRRIAHILGTLDDKIELNRQLNATLEQLARSLFQSWFVDFDPVRAKASGEPADSICRRLGLTPELLALFPAALEDSAMGEIPAGWEVKPFSEVINIIGGGTPKTSIEEYWNGIIPWFSVVDAPSETDVFVIDTKQHISQAGLDNSSTRLLPQYTTIISARGTVGRVALTGCPMTMNQSCYGIGSKNYGSFFTYFATRQLVDILKQSSHGTVFDTITRDTFSRVYLPMPSAEAATDFENTIRPVLQMVQQNCEESRTLATLRDELLPKLLSGEIRLN